MPFRALCPGETRTVDNSSVAAPTHDISYLGQYILF